MEKKMSREKESLTDFRTNQIFLKTVYECGCVVQDCPPNPTCVIHGKRIINIQEEQRESAGKELKHSVQEEAPVIKPLGVGVNDNLGEHWDDKVN